MPIQPKIREHTFFLSFPYVHSCHLGHGLHQVLFKPTHVFTGTFFLKEVFYREPGVNKHHFFPTMRGDKWLLNTLKHASMGNLDPSEVPRVKQRLLWEIANPCKQETGSETQKT